MRQRIERTGGFTIIEVLVALLLLAIVITAIVIPLTGFFGLTQRSTQQVNATNLAQQVIEQIRGEWLSQSKYDQACVVTALPSGVPTITIQNEDVQGAAQGAPVSLSVGGTCGTGTAASAPPLRRLSVTATVSGQSSNTSTLVVEVARP